jgi:hypothetical protein
LRGANICLVIIIKSVSIFVLNLFVINTLSIQSVLGFNGSRYVIASNSVIASARTAALVAINAGTEVFADFSSAGVTKGIVGNKVDYDTAIATARKTKGSDLTLAEVQTQVGNVNVATATASLVAINAGTEIFADFSSAGVTKGIVGNKVRYYGQGFSRTVDPLPKGSYPTTIRQKLQTL